MRGFLALALMCALAALCGLAAIAHAGDERATDVVVGVLLPPGAAARREIERGAAIAAAESEKGPGPRVRIAARAAPPAWGSESNEAAKLLYDDGACGIVAPPDRPASHLAAQIAAKARAPVATLSTARALTRVPLPWIVRVVHDETATLAALLGAVPASAERRRLLAFLPEGREGDRLGESVARAAEDAGFELLAPARAPLTDKARAEAVARATAERADGVLLAIGAAEGAAVLKALRSAKWHGTALAGPDETSALAAAAGDSAEGLVLPRLFDARSTPAAEQFRARYVAKYAEEPSALAAAAHDAVLVLARAANSRGGTTDDARAALLAAPPLDGATGRLAFDAAGNRTDAPRLEIHSR